MPPANFIEIESDPKTDPTNVGRSIGWSADRRSDPTPIHTCQATTWPLTGPRLRKSRGFFAVNASRTANSSLGLLDGTSRRDIPDSIASNRPRTRHHGTRCPLGSEVSRACLSRRFCRRPVSNRSVNKPVASRNRLGSRSFRRRRNYRRQRPLHNLMFWKGDIKWRRVKAKPVI